MLDRLIGLVAMKSLANPDAFSVASYFNLGWVMISHWDRAAAAGKDVDIVPTLLLTTEE